MLLQLCVSILCVHADPDAVRTALKHIIGLAAIFPTFSEENLYACKEIKEKMNFEVTTQIISTHGLKPVGLLQLHSVYEMPCSNISIPSKVGLLIYFTVIHSLKMFLEPDIVCECI